MINKIINSFNKKVYKEITLIEIILLLIGFLSSTLILILYFCLVPNINKAGEYIWPVIIWFDVSFGIVAALALAKKWKYAWILLIFDALLYGGGLYHAELFALAFVNLILVPLLLLISSYTWNYKKKYNNNYIEIKTMKKNEWFFAIFGALIFIIISSLIIIEFSNMNASIWTIIYTVVGAFIASIIMCAMFFSSCRYKGTFVMFLISNSIKVPFFILVTIYFILLPQPNPLMITLFSMYSILAIIYFFNSLYGLYIWTKKEPIYLKNN